MSTAAVSHSSSAEDRAASSLISPVVVRGCLRVAEIAVLIATGLVIAAAYVPSEDLARSRAYELAIVTTALVASSLFAALRLYNPAALAAPVRHLPHLLTGWTGAIGALVAAVFLLKVGPEFSRVWLVAWFTVGCTALIAVRFGAAVLVRHWARQGRLNRRAVIVGGGEACAKLIAALEADPDSDVRIVGIFDARIDGRTPASVAGHSVLGTVDDLIAFGRKTRVDMVILTLPAAAEGRLAEISKQLFVMPVDVRLSAVAAKLKLRPRAYSFVGSVPMLDLVDKPIVDWGGVAKWAFDKVIGTAALVLLAPVMAAVAIAVKLESRGPVLFRQKRYGFNNELIEVFKFRSMYIDKCDTAANVLVTKHDPRVTRVGRFIRKTSLDELPQLFNVVRGELSLVGPRPHALQAKAADKLYDSAVEGYFARHKVKPGITGWAQINGWRGETDTEEKIRRRVEHDIAYIENWSLLLDLYILARTPFALAKAENAY